MSLSEEQVLSLVNWDHYPIPHAEDGPDVHWNLTPRLIPGHREKTAKIDVPGIAKRKRVTKEQEAFRARMLAKTHGPSMDVLMAQDGVRSSFPKGRKLQSRSLFQKRKP